MGMAISITVLNKKREEKNVKKFKKSIDKRESDVII